jgi:hypothetical protein
MLARATEGPDATLRILFEGLVSLRRADVPLSFAFGDFFFGRARFLVFAIRDFLASDFIR